MKVKYYRHSCATSFIYAVHKNECYVLNEYNRWEKLAASKIYAAWPYEEWKKYGFKLITKEEMFLELL